jgi:hypothetical protein
VTTDEARPAGYEYALACERFRHAHADAGARTAGHPG